MAPKDDKTTAEQWAKADGLRTDGFANELTGIGTAELDKTLGGSNGIRFNVNLLPGIEAENRWRGSDLGARLVETVPDEMVREGWELTIQPDDEDEDEEAVGKGADKTALADATQPSAPAGVRTPGQVEPDDEGQALVEALEARLRELGAMSSLREALCYERAYGGSAILLGVDDGQQDLTLPLDESRIKTLQHLTVFRGGWDGEAVAWSYYSDPREPRYGEPQVYQVRNIGVPFSSPPAPGSTALATYQPIPAGVAGAQVFYVHESRLIVFPGIAVSRRARTQMRGWGDSIFTRVDEVLSQYSQTWGAVANLMTDWAQGVLKMKGLAQLLSSQDPKSGGVVAKRMVGINLSKSIARTMLLDSEEEFVREVAPLTGIAEVLQQFSLRLAAAADMPVTLLMGQSPAGLNATGASDIRFFYDRIAAKQRDRLEPQLRRLVRLLMITKDSPTHGTEPKRWSIEMRPLWQMNEAEAVDLRFKQAQADQIYIANGVVSQEEVAASRFGGSKWSGETVLDVEGRMRMAAPDRPPEPDENAVPGAPGSAPPSPAGENGEAPAAEGQQQPGITPAGAPPPQGAEGQTSTLSLTPSAQGAIITVNEARATLGLPPLEGSDGNLTIAEFMAKRAQVVAEAAAAESGTSPEDKAKETEAKAKIFEAGGPPGKGAPPFGKKPSAGEEGEKPPPKKGAKKKAPPPFVKGE